jgi:hypothetical protein
MASFTLVRELAEVLRDKGSKRLLLGLYQAEDSDRTSKYLACSEQQRVDVDSPWVSSRKGITIRASEVATLIAALQSADFDAKPDGKNLTHQEYADKYLDW